MTGESYGGRYPPLFASAVYDQNTQLVKEGREPINLKSVMIGNGRTSLCTHESLLPLSSILMSAIVAMIESIYDFVRP